jgi:tRNA (cytidine/uridine-2'-O-)-methyltransferase
MFDVVLYEPEIAPNTGNIIRLCANAGARLHLIHPLGFRLEDRRLRRAGLDYHEIAVLREHSSLSDYLDTVRPPRLWAYSTRGRLDHSRVAYEAGDALLFGPESHGLPAVLMSWLCPEGCLRIPMRPGNRSLNLSNAVAIVLYEAWRQHGFAGGG